MITDPSGHKIPDPSSGPAYEPPETECENIAQRLALAAAAASRGDMSLEQLVGALVAAVCELDARTADVQR